QAEDGIRDRTVTGVQTCALPISRTLGLIASIDLAPAILERLGLAAPPEMEGRAVSTGPPLSAAALLNYAGQAHANRQGFIPILVAMGLAMALSGAGVVLSLVLHATRAAVSRSRAALGVAS